MRCSGVRVATMSGYAVVDTETTGFSPAHGDRVLEVAVVLLDAQGRVEREWETLLNPDRGVGPTHVHGITAAEVARAPTTSRRPNARTTPCSPRPASSRA